MIGVAEVAVRHRRPVGVKLAIGCRDHRRQRAYDAENAAHDSRMFPRVDVLDQLNARDEISAHDSRIGGRASVAIIQLNVRTIGNLIIYKITNCYKL